MKTVVKRQCANCTDELRMRRVLSSSSCEYSSQAVWRRHELWGLDMSRERKLSKKLLSSSRCWSLSAICNIGKLDRSWDTLLHYNMLLHSMAGQQSNVWIKPQSVESRSCLANMIFHPAAASPILSRPQTQKNATCTDRQSVPRVINSQKVPRNLQFSARRLHLFVRCSAGPVRLFVQQILGSGHQAEIFSRLKVF